MGIFNRETSFFGKQKQQEEEEEEEEEEDAVCLLVSNPSDCPKKKKHVIVTPTPATTTKEDKEKEEQERSEKKKRVTQEKEEGLNPSHRSPKKKKRRAETMEEAERLFSTRLGGRTTSVVFIHSPFKSPYVDPTLVGFCNKALEKYNNKHNCVYEFVCLLKAEKTSLSYISDYEIIFGASLPHEDGFRVETFEASIRTGLYMFKKGLRVMAKWLVVLANILVPNMVLCAYGSSRRSSFGYFFTDLGVLSRIIFNY